MTSARRWAAALAAVWVVAAWVVARAAQRGTGAPASGAALVDYGTDIAPIFKEFCLECHSQDKRKGGLSLGTYADVLEGGRDGAVVRPGNSAGSLMVRHLVGEIEPQMPKDDLPLEARELGLIRRWIDEGARVSRTAPVAPQPWEAPMALEMPPLPALVWPGWTAPIDRLVATSLRHADAAAPALVSDRTFARRVYLDLWGLLPAPEDLERFVADSRSDKRARLVDALLSDNQKYADHWVSFWNDLLRNEDGVSYFSETAGRKAITEWLLSALTTNLPYDRFVAKLVNPTASSDPDGFVIGVNWRGEVSASQTPALQAAQNTAQIFLGVNLKCNSCHDSFISKWKLRDAYGLASFFSPDARLRLFRCDVAQDDYAEPRFLYSELDRTPPSLSLADRRATIAAILTDPRNGRVPRTLVNRMWQRLFGRGLVANPDDLDGRPWDPALLDWLSADFASHGFDVKRLIGMIVGSRAYQLPAVARAGEQPRIYVFRGPEVRRLTGEQFADAIGAITGEWSVSLAAVRAATPPPATPPVVPPRTASDPPSVGRYVREWRAPSSNLTRALGRPIRDQVVSVRTNQATTFQGLELVNGEALTHRLSLGAARMLDRLAPAPLSLYNKAVAGRNAGSSPFDIDISGVSRLWLLVAEGGSNAADRVLPIWANAELVGPSGTTPLALLAAIDTSGVRAPSGTITLNGAPASAVRVGNPSRLVYDIAGRGFTRFRGTVGLENPRSEIGSTLNPQIRFFVFDAEPDMDRLLPPIAGTPLPRGPQPGTASDVVTRVFSYALGRLPSPAERRIAERALADPAVPGRLSAEGLADLLWAVFMKPEFQLIY